MTQIFFTNASTSPWTVPEDFTPAGHTATLIGAGGNGGAGTTSTAGGGGGGGACTKLVYSSGTITPGTTIPFLVPAGNSANATQWQSSTAGTGNFYEALSGGTGSSTGTAGAGGGATTTVGTPTITYTPTNNTGGSGGTGGGAISIGGGGGGGAAGTAASGGAGGSPTSTGGGGGGGGGAANNGGSPSTATGGTGGNGTSGSGGTGGATGNPGTGSSGGGGGNGGAASTGGNGGSGTDFQVSPAFGFGGGGGGSGTKTTTGAVTMTGGNGGSFGGGGGACGSQRSNGGTFNVGTGAAALIVVFYTSAFAWPAPESYYPQQAVGTQRSKRAAAIMTGHIVGSDAPPINLGNVGGNQIQMPQPPARNPSRSGRAAGFMTGHIIGSDAPKINLAVFTEVQPPPPPSRSPSRPAKFAGFARGDDGNEAAFVPPSSAIFVGDALSQMRWVRPARVAEAIEGTAEFLADNLLPWHETISLPPRLWPNVNRRAAIMQRVGFLPSSLAPWYEVKYEVWPKPPRRQSMIGDDGIENAFTTTATVTWGYDALALTARARRNVDPTRGDDGIEGSFNLFPWGYYAQYVDVRARPKRSPEKGDDGIAGSFNLISWGYDLQPLPVRAKMKRDPLHGDDGNEATYAFWYNYGWEIAPPVTYNAKRQKFGAIARGNDGDEGGLINIGNLGFEVQAFQPPHRRFNDLDDGDRGIEYPFVVAATIWGYEAVLTLARPPVRRGDAIDFTVEFATSNLTPVTWETTLPLPYRVQWNRGQAIRLRSGFLASAAALTAWGYEYPPQLRPARLNRLAAARGRTDFGVFASFVPYAWDQIQAWVPPRRRWESWAALIGRNEFAWFTYQPWFEVNADTWRHPAHERIGALSRGDDSTGTFAATVFTPQFDQAWQPPYRRLRTFTIGDTGTESTFTPAVLSAWGYEATLPFLRQPPHRGEAIDLVVEFAVSQLQPLTWEITLPSPYRVPRNIGEGIKQRIGFGAAAPNILPIEVFDQAWQPPYRRYRVPNNGDEGIYVPGNLPPPVVIIGGGGGGGGGMGPSWPVHPPTRWGPWRPEWLDRGLGEVRAAFEAREARDGFRIRAQIGSILIPEPATPTPQPVIAVSFRVVEGFDKSKVNVEVILDTVAHDNSFLMGDHILLDDEDDNG